MAALTHLAECDFCTAPNDVTACEAFLEQAPPSPDGEGDPDATKMAVAKYPMLNGVGELVCGRFAAAEGTPMEPAEVIDPVAERLQKLGTALEKMQ